MSAIKKAAVTVVSLALVGAAGFAGYKLWQKQGGASVNGTVYVTPVSELNTVSAFSLSSSRFSGVVEPQKTEEYNLDSSKKVKSIEVKVGDEVKEGDVLFSYDVEAMKMQLEQGELDVERMENEIEASKLQIEELEKDKKKANGESLVSLNTQILTLQSDIAKTEYDIKAKKRDNKSIKKSIKNSQVTSKEDGIVKTVADLEMLEYTDSNTVVSISKGGNYRVKGTVNEQLVGTIYESMPVVIHSRVDDDVTWSGIISSIETTPQTNNDGMYYGGDDSMRATKYSFYIEPESFDGLMLGQHILIEPDFGIFDDAIEKDGIWLYSDFVFEEDGKNFVWADNGKGRIEKREVKLGQTDDMAGDCEIVSGLDDDDKIAYPSKEIVAGMSATDNAEEADIPEENYGDFGMGEDFDGGEFMDGDFMDGEFMDGDFMDGEFMDGDFMDGDFADAGFIDGGDIDGQDALDLPEDVDGEEPVGE